MPVWVYRMVQWTWGILQSAAGLVALAVYGRGCRRDAFHGAYVTYWRKNRSTSLGMFLFVSESAGPAARRMLLRHEWGHTVQSLMLGPLYLFVVGIPSSWWSLSGRARAWREARGIDYYDFWCEKWANNLAARYLGE